MNIHSNTCALSLLALILCALPAQAAPAGAPISRTEVIARARAWLNHKPQFKYDSSRAPRTLRPDADGLLHYGSDCSGLVSQAWKLPPGRSGGTNTHGLVGFSRLISPNELMPGDILNYAQEHVVLFEAWEPDHKHFSYFSFGHTPMKRYTHATLQNGDGRGKLSGWPVGLYKAYRYRNIIADSGRSIRFSWRAGEDGVPDVGVNAPWTALPMAPRFGVNF